MAENPHVLFRAALEETDDWNPSWARGLQETEGVFTAHPITVYASEIEDLGRLATAGHRVEISAPRLGRTRISIEPGKRYEAKP